MIKLKFLKFERRRNLFLEVSIIYMLLFAINLTNAQTISAESTNPRIKSYFSVVHPVVSFTKDSHQFNFSETYRVGFPVGINFLQSDKIAYSIEFVPTISVNDSSSNVTGLLFHPGVIYRNIGGFNFLTRLAFNTNGRYGFTAVINRPIIKKEKVTYFLAMPIPFRFGNDLPTSVTFGFQFGIIF